MPTKPIVSHIGAAAPSCTRAGPSHNPASAAAAAANRSNAPAGPRKTLRLPRSAAAAAANRNQLRQPMRGGGAGGILTRRWGGGAGGIGPVRHHCNTMLGCGRRQAGRREAARRGSHGCSGAPVRRPRLRPRRGPAQGPAGAPGGGRGPSPTSTPALQGRQCRPTCGRPARARIQCPGTRPARRCPPRATL